MSMTRKTRKRAQSVLGLTLNDGQLHAFHVMRSKGGLEVVKSTSAALTLDLLHPEAELVGREIKNHLDAAGIRERQCVVGLPPRWVMTQQTKLPEISGEDAASFLQLEAEKGFPVDPVELQISPSFQKTTAGTYVTQLAVRREQLDRLSAVLKAAGLKPVSFSLGLAVLPKTIPSAGSGGRITVAADASGVTLLVAAGGGIAAFRTLEAGIESEAGEKLVNGASVGRELRITVEQVPADLRSEVKELFLTGDAALVRQLAESLGDWTRAAGLAVTRGDLPEKNFAAEIAEKLAAQWLEASGPDLEFLPPRPSRWAVMMARYSSKRLATAGFAAAALALAAVGAFAWLEYDRFSLRSEWSGMQAQVTQLEQFQSRIREYRPWYDTSFRTLGILRRITECFPENGAVTAKSVEFRGNTLVTISGTARDRDALLRVQEQLHKLKEVQGLNMEQIRSPVSGPSLFTLSFRWNSSS